MGGWRANWGDIMKNAHTLRTTHAATRRQCRAFAAMAVTALGLLNLPSAGAASICRWVDETGQVQYADVVPDRYKTAVTCTHTPAASRPAEPIQNRNGKRISPPQVASSAAAPPIEMPRQSAKQPSETVSPNTDCKTWLRLFNESGACFAPFRTARGGIKAEAFEKCNEIPNPEEKCGPSND